MPAFGHDCGSCGAIFTDEEGLDNHLCGETCHDCNGNPQGYNCTCDDEWSDDDDEEEEQSEIPCRICRFYACRCDTTPFRLPPGIRRDPEIPSVVHSYSHRPRPIFYGAGPVFLGMELETDRMPAQSDVQYRQAVELACQVGGKLVYLKDDGSISGFEMVTHPMAYDWAMRNFPWHLLASLAELRMRATSNTGIHIHVNRAAFDDSAHVYRFMRMFYRLSHQVQAIARRGSVGYCQWKESDRRTVLKVAKGEGGWDRYVPINTLPEHTYEIRVFRSSLVAQEVQAALGLVDSLVRYTRTLTAKAVVSGGGWEFDTYVRWLRQQHDPKDAATLLYAPLLAEISLKGLA